MCCGGAAKPRSERRAELLGPARPHPCQGGADATWVFMPWEGVLARRAGVELHAFNPEAYLDYGYSPVVAAHPDFLR